MKKEELIQKAYEIAVAHDTPVYQIFGVENLQSRQTSEAG